MKRSVLGSCTLFLLINVGACSLRSDESIQQLLVTHRATIEQLFGMIERDKSCFAVYSGTRSCSTLTPARALEYEIRLEKLGALYVARGSQEGVFTLGLDDAYGVGEKGLVRSTIALRPTVQSLDRQVKATSITYKQVEPSWYIYRSTW